MKKLKTKKLEVILIDNDDYEKLKNHSFHLSHGYPRTCIARKKVMLHQLIMPKQKGMTIDHINRNKLDNRKTNLRSVTILENCQNRLPKKGTYWKIAGREKWRAQIIIYGKKKHLGVYNTEEEAKKAYWEKRMSILANLTRSIK